MDSTRDEENEYSRIDYDYLVVDRDSTNLTSRSQVRSSERNIYEAPTLPLVKQEEETQQNLLESIINSIGFKIGLLVIFILLISAIVLIFCLYARNASILMNTISSQKKTINEKEAAIQQHVADLTQLKSNASALRQQVDELKAVIVSHDADVNRLKNKTNEHTSVMLLGGWHGTITNSTTIYNSMEKSWKNCKLTLPSTLASHGAALLNNEIYIFGGYGNGTLKPFNSLYKLGAGNEWERMADMNEKRKYISQSSVVFNSEIWVIGGWNGTDFLKSMEKYNPKTNKWIKMPELNEPRAHAAATVVDGKIYVSGGSDGWKVKNSVEVYDSEKRKWEIFSPNMLYAVDSHILIRNHLHLIAIGGDLSIQEPTNRVWEIDVLDPKREWKKMPYLRQGRYYSGAAIIADGLMVFGGSTNYTNTIDSVEIFDGVEWKNGAPLPKKRGSFASIPLTHAQETIFLERFCQNS